MVEWVAYADASFILVERNSQLKLEQWGTEHIRSLKVSVANSARKTVTILLKGNFRRSSLVKLKKVNLKYQ